MNKKLVVAAFLICGLAAYGYVVFNAKKTTPSYVSRGPISVAAVRGASAPIGNSNSSGSDVVVDYAKSLNNDVREAQKAADKLEAANKVISDEAHRAAD